MRGLRGPRKSLTGAGIIIIAIPEPMFIAIPEPMFYLCLSFMSCHYVFGVRPRIFFSVSIFCIFLLGLTQPAILYLYIGLCTISYIDRAEILHTYLLEQNALLDWQVPYFEPIIKNSGVIYMQLKPLSCHRLLPFGKNGTLIKVLCNSPHLLRFFHLGLLSQLTKESFQVLYPIWYILLIVFYFRLPFFKLM